MVEQGSGHDREAEAQAAGRRIVERIRREANDEYAYFDGDEGEDVFRSLYLVLRDTTIPEPLLSDDLLLDIHMDIRALYMQVFGALRDELREEFGQRPIWIAVDPSVEDSSLTVMCTDETVLLLYWSKVWRFWWESEDAMAREMTRLYTTAAERLRREPPAHPDGGV